MTHLRHWLDRNPAAQQARRRTMDEPRHIWWNFASSRKQRIEQAKADWKLARFVPCTVPGNSQEFLPPPE
jgi:hypothetical protein